MSPWRAARARSSSNTLGHSPSKARYLVLIIFSVCPPVSFIMMGSKQGFPTMFMSYIVVAFGRAILTGTFRGFDHRSILTISPCLGYAFGVWSLGAVASPLIFQLTAAAGLPWTHFYFGSLVRNPADLPMFLAITFFPTTHEFAVDRKRAIADVDSRTRRSPIPKFDGDDALDSSTTLSQIPSPPNPLRLVSTMPYHWAIALFSMLYCGSETTTQGLIVQYLLAERSADPKTVGYVSSGFWAGVTVARVAWSYFSPRITFTGRKYIIQCSLGLALGMQILIWLVHSDLENTVSASLIGLFFGPIFPACLELATDLLPPEVTMISMAIISATGSLGSAVFPFITGVVTTKYTMRVWSYVTVAQVAVMFGTWWLFPTRQPPRRVVAL
ncbi:major facilitator superfamily domain-containing protein [Mycena vitilis]|nr:major facilitator superfamily domain-containing protein [Mycena vitilis]